MAKTLQEKFAEALRARGETEVFNQRTSKYRVFTRQKGGFYYLGGGGAVRIGLTSTSSLPASDKWKASLIGG